MKIKYVFLTALLLTVSSIGFAQAKKTTAKTTAAAPQQVVKDLYAAQKSEKANPFFQTKSRALIDKYFVKDLADMIWNDTIAAKGEVGAIDFDPLYGSQDLQITNLVVGTPKNESGPDDVFLKVNFKNYGKADSVGFNLRREANKQWKIYDIEYSSGDELVSILRYPTDEEYKKEYDANPFQGNYMIGTMQCFVSPTMSRLEYYRVNCDGQEGYKLYAAEGDETQTAYTYNDDKGKPLGKFVFKNGETDGKYFDAKGKEIKVTRIKDDENPGGMTEESENQNASGELEVGKTKSVILYVGMETGDYAAYCFMNDSDAGRAILAKCKDKEQCEVTATLGDGEGCEVPGLEATLSASFTIAKVISVKSLGLKK